MVLAYLSSYQSTVQAWFRCPFTFEHILEHYNTETVVALHWRGSSALMVQFQRKALARVFTTAGC